MKTYLLFLFLTSILGADMAPLTLSDDRKIAVQNSILAKVNGTTVSMMDVKKKMDVAFYQAYPHLANSNQSRFQFYDASWRHVLMEMIDHQLILADASDKEVKLTDGEIREELETRFGPNITFTLDSIGLTYDEAWKMIKEELIVRRMNWWFVQSKATSSVTPQDIRQAYRLFVKENPPYQEWKYRVITLKGEHPEEMANKAYALLHSSGLSPESLVEPLKAIDPTIQISAEFVAKDLDVAEAHKETLSLLSPGQYSEPKLQKSRTEQKTVARIFYLSEKNDHPVPPFETLAPSLRNELVQKALIQESNTYLEKLRKHYGFDRSHLEETLPEDFHPFAIQ